MADAKTQGQQLSNRLLMTESTMMGSQTTMMVMQPQESCRNLWGSGNVS